MRHCDEWMAGRASSPSIEDGGQDAHPTGNLSDRRKRLLRCARNDSLSPLVTEELRSPEVLCHALSARNAIMPCHVPNNLARNLNTSPVAGRVSRGRHTITGVQRSPQSGAGLFCPRGTRGRNGAGRHVHDTVGEIVFSLLGAASDPGLLMVTTKYRREEVGKSLFFGARGIMGRVVAVAGLGFTIFYVRTGGLARGIAPILQTRSRQPVDFIRLRLAGSVLFLRIPGSAEEAEAIGARTALIPVRTQNVRTG